MDPVAPCCSFAAHGPPAPRHDPTTTLYWGRRTQWRLCGSEMERLGVGNDRLAVKSFDFLHPRQDANGRHLIRLFAPRQQMNDAWRRLPWLPSGGEAAEPQHEKAGWVRPWHGTQIKALYSIVYYPRLLDSRHHDKGERLCNDAPRVYLHKDRARRKAEHYVRFLQLANNRLVLFRSEVGGARNPLTSC